MKELIVATNPAKRRRPRTAKQKAATRKLIAFNKSKGRGRSTTSHRRAPQRRKTTATRRRSPQKRRNVTRRRAPAMFGRGGMNRLFNQQIMPALVGGTGAVANDVLSGWVLQMLPLPPEFTTGPMRHVAKAGSALLLAWAASFMVTRKTADQLGAGALTVVGYNVVREMVQRFAPQIPMGMYLEPSNMGMYLEPSNMGWAGTGWNPTYGNSGNVLGAYMRPSGRGGAPGVPGAGVAIPPQIATEQPYASRWDAQPNYEDDALGYHEYH